MIKFLINLIKSILGLNNKKAVIKVETEANKEDNSVSSTITVDPVVTTAEEDKKESIVEAEVNIDHNEETQEISSSVEIKIKKVYIPFTDEDKEQIVDIVRPIIKTFNDSNKNKAIEYLGENLKYFKNFMTISEDNESIQIRLTQSNSYNISCVKFLLDIFKPMIVEALNKLDAQFEVGVNDNGYIEIYKYENQEITE